MEGYADFIALIAKFTVTSLQVRRNNESSSVVYIYVIMSVASLPPTMFVHISTFGIFNYVVVLVNKFFEF